MFPLKPLILQFNMSALTHTFRDMVSAGASWWCSAFRRVFVWISEARKAISPIFSNKIGCLCEPDAQTACPQLGYGPQPEDCCRLEERWTTTRHFNISFVNFKWSDLPGHHILLTGRHVLKGFHRFVRNVNIWSRKVDVRLWGRLVMFPRTNVSSFTFRCKSRYPKCSTLTNERIPLRFWDTCTSHPGWTYTNVILLLHDVFINNGGYLTFTLTKVIFQHGNCMSSGWCVCHLLTYNTPVPRRFLSEHISVCFSRSF